MGIGKTVGSENVGGGGFLSPVVIATMERGRVRVFGPDVIVQLFRREKGSDKQ
jgi:hypothetical protein